MSDFEEGPPLSSAPPAVLLTYGMSSTTVIYGLPAAKRDEVLDRYRERYYKRQRHMLRLITNRRTRERRRAPSPNMQSYDLCCDYYWKVYTMQVASTDSLFDDDSDDDSDMPSLESMAPSDSGSPIIAATSLADAAADPPSPSGEAYDSSPFIPVSDIPAALPFPTNPFHPDANRNRNDCPTDGEGVERVRSLLNQINRPQYELDHDERGHHITIISRNGPQNLCCRCHDGEHSRFERRQAFAFPDREGNIVVKKSKSLLLPV
ncbi:hypothetical protein C8R46DRAFT_1214525 [Mycena filopes]|nr:hypothetical protein C8R46DRAFT_1214525 [Mycena filopes]